MLFALLLFFAEPNDIEEALRKVAGVYALVEEHAADPVDPSHAFYEGALPSMLRELDPHSIFFDPDQFQQLKEMQRSESKGFGTVVSVLPGRVIILQALPGAPAAKAGIEAGDEILAINGIRLDWLEPEQLIGLLGETRRKEARLDVRRQGTPRLLQFMLIPEALQSPSVDRAFLLQPGIGFIRITSFETETGKQVKQAIEKLGGASLKGLVLDMRENPGGVVGGALDTASLFLPAKAKLLSTKGRAIQGEDALVPDGNTPYTFPLAILINEKTASASEIVAGAMQDHQRAKLVGQPSYGKGLVQSVFPLSQNTGLALTTAYYYTPNGRSIQRHLAEGQLEAATRANSEVGGGLKPDIAAYPEGSSRLRAVLDGSGAFTSFATETVRKNPGITPAFEVSGPLLDDFRIWLAERQITPGVSDWSVDKEWIRSRLHQEIFNQALGVDKGDEVEMRRDPIVRRAIDTLQP